LQTQLAELNEKFSKSNCLNLFSQAANELREGIRLIETEMLESNDTLHKMNLHAWFFKSKVIFYSNLMYAEFGRRNFDDAIQIYKKHFERRNIDMNKKILSRDFPTLQLRYHEALLRQGKGSIDTFISLSKLRITHSMKHDNKLERDLILAANILRTTKHFDAAIAIGKQLEELTGDTVSLSTTYLEQYLVEYYPKFGRNIDSLPESFEDMFKNMGTAFGNMLQKYYNGGFDTSEDLGPLLVLAQSTYLVHQYSSDGTEATMRKAIGFIQVYLNSLWNLKTHCITCCQAGTPRYN
jgi:tetratricopeptide (TPR) repeat protein